MAQGITWAADNGARVANLSFSGAAGSYSVASAASYMMDRGGVVVVAAGNDNTDYGYVNHSSLYVAGATTSSETKASYSSYGAFVDISAPGSSIYTTNRSGGYSNGSGTSFSSPNAAAAAALVIGANPALLPTDVMAVLSTTAVDLGSSGWDPQFGHGRVNAQAAVELAANADTSDITAPNVGIADPVANATVSDQVAVTVEAVDAFGVSRVDFLVDGVLVASENQSVGANQYLFSWDSTQASDGQHKFSARAVDAAGNSGSAQDVFVTVANTQDDEAPVATITSPGDGASGSKNVTLAAHASDNVGVTQISIYVGGKLKCSGTSSASCGWNLRKVASGTYTIMDAAGNQGSSSVSFTVGGSSDTGGGGNRGKGAGKKK